MNKKQLKAMWIGVVVVVLMVIVPPWVNIYNGNAGAEGYRFIFWPPENGWPVVDTTRLVLQWIAVAVVTGAAIWTLKDRKV